MAKYILGIDEGTTGARTFIIDEKSNVLGLAAGELTQHYPRPGWIEHDPMEILTVQYETMRAALREAKLSPSDLTAVAITNQRETAMVWEKDTGRPIYNAIVWASRQTTPVIEKWVEQGLSEKIETSTGLIPDAYYSASKIAWILDNVEGARERAEKGELLAGTVDTWLVWNLTGRKSFVTDVSNGARTMMMNLETLKWDEELLAAYDIPRHMLAEIVPSDSIFGDIEASFGSPVPIASVLGDQQAGLFGQAAFAPGQCKMTYGTAGVFDINTGDKPLTTVEGLTASVAWKVQGQKSYTVEGVLFAMGKTMQWLRDDLNLIHAAPDSEWYAGQVNDTGGVYLVPAFTGLGAPEWDPYARAVIAGISNATTRLHVIRAAVESMAFQTRDLVDAFLKSDTYAIPELRVDGGAVRNNLLCQLQADILQIPVVRPRISEATVFGTMLLSGLTTGVFDSLEHLAAQWQPERVFEPQATKDWAEHHYNGWREARELTKGWTKKIGQEL